MSIASTTEVKESTGESKKGIMMRYMCHDCAWQMVQVEIHAVERRRKRVDAIVSKLVNIMR